MNKSAQGIVRWTRGRGTGFTHGSGFLDGNGFVHYTPDANYYGAAQFNYSIKAVTGQKRAANDSEWFCERLAA